MNKAEIDAAVERVRLDRARSAIAIAIIALIALGAPALWVIQSYFESSTYNRLTGSETTTWDAMWVELRVMDGAK